MGHSPSGVGGTYAAAIGCFDARRVAYEMRLPRKCLEVAVVT